MADVPDQVAGEVQVIEGAREAPKEEATVEQFREAASLGRAVIREARERQRQGLTDYLDPEGFHGRGFDFLANDPQEANLVSNDVSGAERASLEIALEAAAQIIGFRPPSRGKTTEDTRSLRKLAIFMEEGDRLRAKLGQKDSGLVSEQVGIVLGRKNRRQGFSNQPRTDQQLDDWAQDQFGRVIRGMNKKIQLYEG